MLLAVAAFPEQAAAVFADRHCGAVCAVFDVRHGAGRIWYAGGGLSGLPVCGGRFHCDFIGYGVYGLL